MTDRYLIVSDLHLSDVEEHRKGWKYFKSARYHADEELAKLVGSFLEGGKEGDTHLLVLNGDVFDFDLVTAVPESSSFKVARHERRAGLDPTSEKSRWKLERTLKHHPLFLDTLVDVITSGGKIVYILGNHDREMHFRELQDSLEEALRESARSRGVEPQGSIIEFKPWFYHVPGVLFAEHGNQYDHFTSYRNVLSPTVEVDGREQLALPMGNLSNRYLLSRMGSFNPFSGNYILSGAGYFLHWARHYALSPTRHLVYNWLSGSLIVFFVLLKTRKRVLACSTSEALTGLRDLAASEQMSFDKLESILELHCPPVYERVRRIARELWLDRLLILLAMIGITVAVSFSNMPLWVKLGVLLVGFPVAYMAYESLVSKESIFDVQQRVPETAAAIAEILDVPLVTFGHDHVPRVVSLESGAVFVDSGTWAPITDSGKDGPLVPGLRNYLIIEDHQGNLEAAFGSWQGRDKESEERITPRRPGSRKASGKQPDSDGAPSPARASKAGLASA